MAPVENKTIIVPTHAINNKMKKNISQTHSIKYLKSGSAM
jgi:hypothetical protein